MSVLRSVTAAGLCLVVGSTLAFAGKKVVAPRRPVVRVAQGAQVLPPPPPVQSDEASGRQARRPVVSTPMTSLRRSWSYVPEPEEVRLRYQGTIISPDKKATGPALALQEEIAALISRMDFKPDARLAHFRWMADQPVRITAWRGRIEGMQRTPDGVLARVRVWPDATPLEGKRMGHMDHFYETYLYANGRVALVGCDDPGPCPGFIRL